MLVISSPREGLKEAIRQPPCRQFANPAETSDRAYKILKGLLHLIPRESSALQKRGSASRSRQAFLFRLAVPPPARRDRGTAQDLCVLAYPGWVSIERQQRTIGFSFRCDLCLGSRLHEPHTATPGVPAADGLFNTTPPASPPAAVVHIDARKRRTSVSQLGLRPTKTTGHPHKKSSRRQGTPLRNADGLSTSEPVCWSQLTNLSWTQACRMSLQSSAGQPSCANIAVAASPCILS